MTKNNILRASSQLAFDFLKCLKHSSCCVWFDGVSWLFRTRGPAGGCSVVRTDLLPVHTLSDDCAVI